MTLKVLVTGGNGFVGGRLSYFLHQSSTCKLTCSLRNLSSHSYGQKVIVDSLSSDTDWSSAVVDQDVIIHTAARAHIMKDEVSDPLAEYRKVNVEGTLNFARQAAKAGVKRFIFISSIKVNGEQTPLNRPFYVKDSPAPEDAYGISKLEAEQGLKKLALETGMEVVIIRPSLVYGSGVKGNFASMIKLVEKGLPLPLGAIHNKRSLVALDNLVDLIATCIDHPAAANRVFLAADGQDISTSELLRAVARSMGKSSRLFPVPAGLLMVGATMLGKKAVAQRLLGSLQVDISEAQDVLGWHPPLTVEEGIKSCFEPRSHT